MLPLPAAFLLLLAQSDPDLTVWPNAVSSANSDRWLVENHDELRRLEPRLLVLDFVNDVPAADVRKKVDDLVAVSRRARATTASRTRARRHSYSTRSRSSSTSPTRRRRRRRATAARRSTRR